MIVDCAHYVAGERQHEGQMPLDEVAACRRGGDSFVWLGLHEPSRDELKLAQATFGLHDLAVEDALKAHQRPKIEDYDGSWFIVLKTARYDDAKEEVEFGEIELFLGSGYAVVVRHGGASELKLARRRAERRKDLLALGPVAAAWAIVDKVVDDYEPVVAGIDNDVGEVEEQVFSQEGDPTQRIYFLKREVIEFHQAVRPLIQPLEQLERGEIAPVDETLQRYFRDVADHARRVDEQVLAHREILTSVLEANLALLSVRQSEVVRTISAWAAIITVPTFIASVYGMNFDEMPELGWEIGYPLALTMMALIVFALHRGFKKSGWI